MRQVRQLRVVCVVPNAGTATAFSSRRRCLMKTRLLTGTLGAMLFFSPYMFAQDDQKPSPTRSTRTERRASESRDSGMSRDMREAIAWERAKDRAAERQAR